MMQQTLALPRVICFLAYNPNRSSLIYISATTEFPTVVATQLSMGHHFVNNIYTVAPNPAFHGRQKQLRVCPHARTLQMSWKSPRLCSKLWVIYGVFLVFSLEFVEELHARLRGFRKRRRRLRRCGGWRRPWSGWPKRKRNRGAQNWGGRNGGFSVSPCFTKQCMEISMEISLFFQFFCREDGWDSSLFCRF